MNQQEIPRAPERNSSGVAFHTASHTFKFAVDQNVVSVGSDDIRAEIIARLYGADDGNPYYHVRWFVNKQPRGTFLEHAASLERQYRAE